MTNRTVYTNNKKLTIITTADWDDAGARAKLKKSLELKRGVVDWVRFRKALEYALATSDFPVIAPAIADAIRNAYQEGKSATK